MLTPNQWGARNATHPSRAQHAARARGAANRSATATLRRDLPAVLVQLENEENNSTDDCRDRHEQQADIDIGNGCGFGSVLPRALS